MENNLQQTPFCYSVSYPCLAVVGEVKKGLLEGVPHQGRFLALTTLNTMINDEEIATNPILLLYHLVFPSCDGGSQKGASGRGFPPQKISGIGHSLY